MIDCIALDIAMLEDQAMTPEANMANQHNYDPTPPEKTTRTIWAHRATWKNLVQIADAAGTSASSILSDLLDITVERILQDHPELAHLDTPLDTKAKLAIRQYLDKTITNK